MTTARTWRAPMAVLDRRLKRLDRITRGLCRLAPRRGWRDAQPAEAG